MPAQSALRAVARRAELSISASRPGITDITPPSAVDLRINERTGARPVTRVLRHSQCAQLVRHQVIVFRAAVSKAQSSPGGHLALWPLCVYSLRSQ